eukprot:4119949-Prorocentrum_lima.AAC.1
MTSSLVGSEMCIRDSHTSGQGDNFEASTGQQHRMWRWWICRCSQNQSQSCLLYTSDAADDM